MKLEDGDHEGKCKEALGITLVAEASTSCLHTTQPETRRQYLSFSM